MNAKQISRGAVWLAAWCAMLGLCLLSSGCLTTILGGAAASAVGGVATSYWSESHHEKFYNLPFIRVWQGAMLALRESDYVIISKNDTPPEEKLEVVSRDQKVFATLTFQRVNPTNTRLAIYASDPYRVPDRIHGAALLASIDAKLAPK